MAEGFTQDEIRDIFSAACDIPASEQEAFVLKACAGREGLIAEVMSLLRYDAKTESGDGLTPAGHLTNEEIEIEHPTQIGPYAIRSQIGQGGCGVVYLAHQSSPIERDVALKLIKPGMDSASVLRRFEFERKALERMNHPNIARVLDSGIVTTEEHGYQRPYFVMELVDGVPINSFARDEGLGIEQRIDLLIQVCAAVQHAHSKGILHRDIKPSNILVTSVDQKPLCKVIDFGIAKALDDTSGASMQMTSMGALVGTPRYMSPEQMGANGDIDTRSDVYSIGIVLYELLTGRSPYDSVTDSENIASLLSEISSSPVSKPSSRVLELISDPDNAEDLAWPGNGHRAGPKSRIPRDLDWITLRAMEKDPERRYQTVAALGDDLRRFLSGDAVDAGPPTIQYKLSKFVSRNRAGVIGASVALFALIAGTSVSVAFGIKTSEALKLEQEQREIAQRNENRVQDINDFLLRDLFRSVAAERLGPDAKIAELLDGAAPTIDERFDQDIDMRTRAHYLIGEMYGNIHEFTKAKHHLSTAIDLLSETKEWSDLDRATLYRIRARTLLDNGELDRAIEDFERSRAYLESIEPTPTGDLQIVHLGLATIYQAQGRISEAEPMLDEAIEFALQQEPVDIHWLSVTVSSRLGMLGSLDKTEESLELADWLIDFCERNGAPEDRVPIFIAKLHRTNALGRLGRASEVVGSIDDMLDETDSIFGKRSPAYISALQTAAAVTKRVDRLELAISYIQEAIEVTKSVYGEHHYEVERNTNTLAFYYKSWDDREKYVLTRTRGLLLRLYVAGPGEQESLLGITPLGIELVGSREAWEQIVIDEFERLGDGHNKRARYFANAAISLGAGQLSPDSPAEEIGRHNFGAWMIRGAESIDSAERPDEVRRILQGVLPDYLRRFGDAQSANMWNSRLDQSS